MVGRQHPYACLNSSHFAISKNRTPRCELKHEIRREAISITFDCLIEAKCGNTLDFAKSRSSITRTPRIVRIIASICSIGIGDLGFFGIGDTDYSETVRATSVLEESW